MCTDEKDVEGVVGRRRSLVGGVGVEEKRKEGREDEEDGPRGGQDTPPQRHPVSTV